MIGCYVWRRECGDQCASLKLLEGAVYCYCVGVGVAVDELGGGLLLLSDGPGQGDNANWEWMEHFTVAHDLSHGIKFVKQCLTSLSRREASAD